MPPKLTKSPSYLIPSMGKLADIWQKIATLYKCLVGVVAVAVPPPPLPPQLS